MTDAHTAGSGALPEQLGRDPDAPDQPGLDPDGPDQPGLDPDGPDQPGLDPDGPDQPGSGPGGPGPEGPGPNQPGPSSPPWRPVLVMLAVALLAIGGILLLIDSLGHHRHPEPSQTTTPPAALPPLPGGGAKKGKTPRTSGGTGPATTVPGGNDKLRTDASPAALTPCVASPRSCGYPDASNTGVPPGVHLTPSGSITVGTDGAVVDAMDVSGSITVQANDVTIENSRVTCGDGCSARFTINVASTVSGLNIHDVEAAGNPSVGADVGGGGPATLLRANLHGAVDGVHVVTGSVIRDSYIHDLTPTLISHDDAIQQIPSQANGVTIVHNTLIPYNFAMHIFNNSAFICGSQCSATTNMTFSDNLLDGGSHTLQCPVQGTAGNVFARNRFGRNYRFGPITKACTTTPGNEFDPATNTYDGSNQSVTSTKGT